MLHALRSARFVARLVLAWFVVSMGVAVAAPVMHPQQAMERLCSGTGEMRWVPSPAASTMAAQARPAAAGDDAVPAVAHPALDCPLCLAATPPPWGLAVLVVHAPAQPQHEAAERHAPQVRLTRAPFPPRAPPARA